MPIIKKGDIVEIVDIDSNHIGCIANIIIAGKDFYICTIILHKDNCRFTETVKTWTKTVKLIENGQFYKVLYQK